MAPFICDFKLHLCLVAKGVELSHHYSNSSPLKLDPMDVATRRDLLASGVVHRPWFSLKLSAVYAHTYMEE